MTNSKNNPEDAKISCHFCSRLGHRIKDCRSYLAAQKMTKEKIEARNKGGRGRGRGGYKRGSRGKKSGSRGGKTDADGDDTKRRIAKLGEAGKKAAAGDSSDEEQGN